MGRVYRDFVWTTEEISSKQAISTGRSSDKTIALQKFFGKICSNPANIFLKNFFNTEQDKPPLAQPQSNRSETQPAFPTNPSTLGDDAEEPS